MAAAAKVRDAEAVATAKVSAAASLKLDGKIERLKQRYEQKMAKMYRHLSEREAYEHKLKLLIENEVSILHQYNRELDGQSRGRRATEWQPVALDEFVADRMRGMADKVEQRILHGLRRMDCTRWHAQARDRGDSNEPNY